MKYILFVLFSFCLFSCQNRSQDDVDITATFYLQSKLLFKKLIHLDSSQQKLLPATFNRVVYSYETPEKEQAYILLRSEIAMKKQAIRLYIIISITLLLVLLFLILWLIIHARNVRLKYEAELRAMLFERQMLNQKNEELRQQLEQIDDDNGLERFIANLSLHLLTPDEDSEFRHLFIKRHPSFLIRLREKYTSITQGEELLCMMIRVHLSTEEIAIALGNNKASVNTARFRLRKRLEIAKEASLEECICKL